MAGSETIYTARFIGPEILEKGRANVVSCSVYRDGALATVASGTLTVWNAANTEIVSAAAATITANVATYSIASATLTNETNSDGWRFEWAITIAGIAYTFRRDGSLVYRRLYPVVTDADLLRAHTDLSTRRPSSEASYQDYLDEAWARIESRLVNTGRRPWLIMSPSALRDVHTYATMALVFRDWATGGPESADWAMMEKYEGLYDKAWAELTFPQADANGTNSDSTRRTSADTTVWLGGAPVMGYR